MVPHKTNLSDPQVETGCWKALQSNRCHPSATTLLHHTTDSAELTTIASDL